MSDVFDNKDDNESKFVLTENLIEKGNEGDISSSVYEMFRNDSEKRIRDKVKPEFHEDFDGIHCVECGDEIPEGRLALQKIKCVFCQEAFEKIEKMYNKNS